MEIFLGVPPFLFFIFVAPFLYGIIIGSWPVTGWVSSAILGYWITSTSKQELQSTIRFIIFTLAGALFACFSNQEYGNILSIFFISVLLLCGGMFQVWLQENGSKIKNKFNAFTRS